VGTSTGGIIALSLGLGMPADDLVRFYELDGPRIFPQGGRFVRMCRHLVRSKFDSATLVRVLRNKFGEALLGESKKGLAIPYYDLDQDKPCVFKTPHHPDFLRDKDVPAWKVAEATSAAPTYLPATRNVGGMRLVDGGVWANNPVMVGIVEAARLGVPMNAVRVLSIGTGECVTDRPRFLDSGGLLPWARSAADVMFRAQSEAATNQARLLLGQDRFHRDNPVGSRVWRDLDVLKRDVFSGRAWQGSKELTPVFNRMFGGHSGKVLEGLRVLGEAASEEQLNVVEGPIRSD
jgi:patatin-like phospholipase/acyl hydrolase